jgi:predicted homoserine dehydrogenase-like protein
MIIIDRILQQRERDGNPIRVGMIGAGFMGRGLANTIINATPGMELVAIANRNLPNARRAYEELGITDLQETDDARGVERAISQGIPCVTENPYALTEAGGIDALCEVTGNVEYGTRVTMSAVENGKHMILMNAELDGTLGPLLRTKAEKAGVVVSGCNGDQPGVQVDLWRFVKQIGCTPLLLGNIKGLQDEHRNPTTQEGFAKRWGQNAYMVTSFADGTKISFEQATVANATGMTVCKRGMMGWDHEGHVDDYVVGAKPNPGIYCMATHDDPRQRHYLELYKLGTGPLYSFYTPYHLCHFEVPNSIARAVLFNDPTVSPLDGPRVEAITTAKRALPAGHVLDGLGGYDSYAQAERADITRAERLLPMGVAEGCRLTRAVGIDEVISYDDVELPKGRMVDELRAEQEELFPVV